jgi:NAD(P)-dependent dehydrogenase (short-subunit alcohol dehydrogenase family)
MHRGAGTELADIDWTTRRWNGSAAYSESKLYDTVLAAVIARRFPQVVSTAVSPGWVATKMGGAGAPDDLEAGSVTQAWLAVSQEPEALRSGTLYYHQRPVEAHPAVHDAVFGDALVDALASLTGVALAPQ